MTPILKEFIEKDSDKSVGQYPTFNADFCSDYKLGFKDASELYLSRMKEFDLWKVDNHWACLRDDYGEPYFFSTLNPFNTITHGELLDKFIEHINKQ